MYSGSTNLVFPISTDTQGIVVEDTLRITSIVPSASWIKVSEETYTNWDHTYNIKPDTNTEPERSGTVTFNGVSLNGVSDSYTLTIDQRGNDPNIVLNPTTITALPAGGSYPLSVNSTLNWQAFDYPTWATPSPVSGGGGNNNININVAANNTTSQRTGRIRFNSYGFDTYLDITQPTASLSVSPSYMVAGYTSTSSNTVTVTTDAESWSASGQPSWATLTRTSGTSGQTLGFTCTANPTVNARTGSCTISIPNGNSTVVQVTQYGKPEDPRWSLNPTSWNAPNSGGSTTTVFSTNQASAATSSSASWLTVSPLTIFDGSTITISASSNTGAARTGYVYIQDYVGGTTRATFTVTQGAASVPTISVSPASLTLPALANTSSAITVTSSAAWTASSNQSWCTISRSSGTSGQTLTATVTTNPNGSTRTATITFVNGTATATCTVTQQAATLTINPTLAVGSEKGGTGSFTVSSNISWTTSTGTGITVTSGSSGTGNGTVGYSYAANPGGSRNLTISVAAGSLSATFRLQQEAQGTAPVLTLTPNSKVFNAGVDTQSITVISSSAWTATSNASWLTLSGYSGVGNAALTARTVENTGTTTREGRITFTNTQGAVAVFVGSQYGGAGVLTVYPSEVTVDGGNSFIISITSTTSWSVSQNTNWMSFSPATGTGNGLVTVQVGSSSGSYRYGNITVTAGGFSQTVNVTCTDRNS